MESQTLEHPLTKSAATRAEARTREPVFKAQVTTAPRAGLLARAEPTVDLYNTIIACAVDNRSGKD